MWYLLSLFARILLTVTVCDKVYVVWYLIQVSKMLYVFHVDTGTMLTFDMNVAMQRSVFSCLSYDTGIG